MNDAHEEKPEGPDNAPAHPTVPLPPPPPPLPVGYRQPGQPRQGLSCFGLLLIVLGAVVALLLLLFGACFLMLR